MKKIRTFLAALTAVTMCVGAVPVAQVHLPQVSVVASAESADGLTYKLINNGTEISITGYDTDMTSVTIPAEIEGKPVTTIGQYAFSTIQYAKESKLLKVMIPDSVTSIGESAFSDCVHLRSVTLPNSVKTLGESVFSECTGLKEITLSDNLIEIPDSAFNKCSSLTNITLPESVTTIGYCAFKDCVGLKQLSLPSDLTDMGHSVFSGCSSLRKR